MLTPSPMQTCTSSRALTHCDSLLNPTVRPVPCVQEALSSKAEWVGTWEPAVLQVVRKERSGKKMISNSGGTVCPRCCLSQLLCPTTCCGAECCVSHCLAGPGHTGVQVWGVSVFHLPHDNAEISLEPLGRQAWASTSQPSMG